MTHKAIFRQHWSEAFRDAAFRARLHDPDMAERWAQARFAEEFLPLRQRLCCVKLIEAAAEAMPEFPAPEGGWSGYVLSDAIARLYPQHRREAAEQQEDFALCALLAVQLLLAEERRDLEIKVYDSVSGALGMGMTLLQPRRGGGGQPLLPAVFAGVAAGFRL